MNETNKLLFRGHAPYCDRADCKWWQKCTLAVTDKVRAKGEPEIKSNRACYETEAKEEEESNER